MTKPNELYTNRLVLKEYTPSIINEVFSVLSKQDCMNYFTADENRYLLLKEMFEGGMETHRISMRMFLITDKITKRTLGECGFHTWNVKHNRAEIYYLIYEDKDKQMGYMKEALHTIIPYGFNQLRIHRIAGLVDAANIASRKILEYFGFVKEGVLRQDYKVGDVQEDSVIYSLLKQEYPF
jgi:[ribosomal protein S5]-alanine N-acetyltransferase